MDLLISKTAFTGLPSSSRLIFYITVDRFDLLLRHKKRINTKHLQYADSASDVISHQIAGSSRDKYSFEKSSDFDQESNRATLLLVRGTRVVRSIIHPFVLPCRIFAGPTGYEYYYSKCEFADNSWSVTSRWERMLTLTRIRWKLALCFLFSKKAILKIRDDFPCNNSEEDVSGTGKKRPEPICSSGSRCWVSTVYNCMRPDAFELINSAPELWIHRRCSTLHVGYRYLS